MVILPGEVGIHYLRGTMGALGLKSGSRIRALLLVIQSVNVPVAGLYVLCHHGMVTEPFLV